METSTCKGCNQEFKCTLENFYFCKTKQKLKTARCRECTKKKNREYYLKNKKKCNANAAKYRRTYTKSREFKDKRNARLKEKRRIAREKREAEKQRLLAEKKSQQ